MELADRDILLERASTRLAFKVKLLFALALCVLALSIASAAALSGPSRALALSFSGLIALGFGVFALIHRLQAHSALRELQGYLEHSDACWHWTVGDVQWRASAPDYNFGLLTEALSWPVRGAVAGCLLYCLAFLMTGQGSREGLVRFSAIGFAIACSFGGSELLGIRRAKGAEVRVVVTPGGIYLDDAYCSFREQGEVPESVSLREASCGLELVVRCVSSPWLVPSRREISLPVPPELRGEALVALTALPEAWDMRDEVLPAPEHPEHPY